MSFVPPVPYHYTAMWRMFHVVMPAGMLVVAACTEQLKTPAAVSSPVLLAGVITKYAATSAALVLCQNALNVMYHTFIIPLVRGKATPSPGGAGYFL